MNTTSITAPQLYSLSLGKYKSWLLSAAFIAGNIIFPQLAHLVPNGGLILLPIYFFTLIGAYKYGWQVGLLTAIASPLINHLLFGMPAEAMLPIIMLKGSLLAVIAGYAAHRYKSASLWILACVVLAYQIIGCAIESAFASSIWYGIQDFRIGFPGILLQIFGGWAVINYILRK